MPRAFLITNKRYHPVTDFQSANSRETSPERSVRTAEEPAHQCNFINSNDDASRSRLTCSPPFSTAAAAEALLALLPASPRSPANLTRELSPSLQINDDSEVAQDLTVSQVISPETSRRHAPSFASIQPCESYRMLEPNEEPIGLSVSSVFKARSDIFTSTSAIAAVLQRVMTAPRIHTAQNLSPPYSSSDKHLADSNSHDPGQSSSHVHVCPECGKRYSTSSNLARHRQTHRSVEDRRAARQCPHCEKVYVSMPAFSMHVRTHGQGCRCPYCGKCFSRPWLLQGHIRTHTGEKPFSCPICAKAFADKSNLRAHIQTHSSTKPFVCGRCGKAFALKSYLYKHEESSCMRIQGKGHSENSLSPTHQKQDPEQYDEISMEAENSSSHSYR